MLIMKGEITLKILEALRDSAMNIVDLADAFLSAGYGASYKRLQFEFSKKQKEREVSADGRRIKQELLNRYYSLLYKLKKDGLIKQTKNNKKLLLTKKGLGKLFFLKKRIARQLPQKSYLAQPNNAFVVIAFDIPEIERKKRAWLRSALKNMNLTKVQKSVWIGKVKIPKEFLSDIFRLKLVDYVEIFEITKKGSLTHLV